MGAPAVDLLRQAGDGLAVACGEPAAPRRFAACAPGPVGHPHLVSVRDADDMVRQVEQFLALAEHAVRGVGPRRTEQ